MALKKHDKTESKSIRDVESYLQDRVQYKINVYECVARRYKWIYRIMASIGAIGAAAVPVIINMEYEISKDIATLISLAVAIIIALDKIYLPREHWRTYTLISAYLREEEMRYSTGSAPYTALKVKNAAFLHFVERVENAIHNEREETILMRTEEKKFDTT